jgi:hypothetical protein
MSPWFYSVSPTIFCDGNLRLLSRLKWSCPPSELLRSVILTFRDYISVPSARVKLILVPSSRVRQPQRSSSLGLLKIGPVCTPETSVSNHRTLRNNPQDGRLRNGTSSYATTFRPHILFLFTSHSVWLRTVWCTHNIIASLISKWLYRACTRFRQFGLLSDLPNQFYLLWKIHFFFFGVVVSVPTLCSRGRAFDANCCQ